MRFVRMFGVAMLLACAQSAHGVQSTIECETDAEGQQQCRPVSQPPPPPPPPPRQLGTIPVIGTQPRDHDLGTITVTAPPDMTGRWMHDQLYNRQTGHRPRTIADVGGTGTEGKSGDATGDAAQCDGSVGNPIVPSTGNKIETEVEFATAGEMPLSLERTWNQQASSGRLFGSKWLSNFDLRLEVMPDGKTIHAHRPNGARIRYVHRTTPSIAFWEDRPGGRGRIVADGAGGHVLHVPDNTVETYGAHRRVTGIRNPRGVGLSLAYRTSGTSQWLEQVTHTSGRSIRFTWTERATGPEMTSVLDPAGNEYRYEYDVHQRLVRVVQPGTPGTITTYHYASKDARLLGKSLDGVRYSTFAYDAKGRAILSEHAGGADRHTFAYTDNADGTLTVEHVNPLGKKSTTRYKDGKVLSVAGQVSTHCVAAYREITYDAHGHEDLVADFAGNFTDYDHDPSGLLLKRTEAVGKPEQRTTTYAWDAHGRTTRQTIAGSAQIDYGYRSDGLLSRVTTTNLSSNGRPGEARSLDYLYTFHPNGLIASITEDGPLAGSGDAVTRTFDGVGHLVGVRNSLGHQVTYADHNVFGQPGRETNANGGVIERTYDARGRLLVQARVDGTVRHATHFSYTTAGKPASVTTPDGVVTRHAYDAVQRLVEITRAFATMSIAPMACHACEQDPEYPNQPAPPPPAPGRVDFQRFIYNANSQVVSVQIGRTEQGATTITRSSHIDHDELGRVRRVRGNDGQWIATTYDDLGNPVRTTDALGRVNRLTYDALLRVIEHIDPNGGRTYFAYDAADRVVRVTDARGLATHYTVDGFGQSWKQASPDSGITTFEYGVDGLRTRMVRNDGSALDYAYDALGRLIQVDAANENRIYKYDFCENGKGLLCQASVGKDGLATNWHRFAFTPHGEPYAKRESVWGWNDVTWYARDGMGRLTGITHPNGLKVRYAWADGVIAGVYADMGAGEVAVVTEIAYQPFGAATGWRHGNGLQRRQDYDNDGRITAISVRDANVVRQSLTYQHDIADRVTRLTNGIDAAQTQTYGYDWLDRLTEVNGATYAYDRTGNRTRHVDGAATDYAIDPASNRVLSALGKQDAQFFHDANGNTIEWTQEGATHRVAYDEFNRLSQHVSAHVHDYLYDAFDQRLAKVRNGAAHRFVNDGHRLLAEVNASGQWTSYIWLGNTLVGMVRTTNLFAIHTDHLGRPESATNWYRDVAWRAKLGAFGWDGIAVSLIADINIGFPGQYRDWESGWWQNGYRSYSSLKGGYEQSDPSGLAGGINTYAYAGASPTMNVDPEGLQFFPYSRNLNKRDGHQIPDGVAQRLNVVWGIGTAGATASVYSPVITAAGMAAVSACRSEQVRNALIESCMAWAACIGTSPSNPPTTQRHDDHVRTQQTGEGLKRETKNVWKKVIFPGR